MFLVNTPHIELAISPNLLPSDKCGLTQWTPEQTYLVGGIPTPLKNMKVSWDDDIPNMERHKIHGPNHQSVT